MCPVGSRFLSFKGEASTPDVILCEKVVPHHYVLLFPDGRQRHVPLISLTSGDDIIKQLKILNWDPLRLKHVETVHEKNLENENLYFETRQTYQSLSILDMINSNSNRLGILGIDPCHNSLDSRIGVGREFAHKYSCQVMVSENQRQRLGIEKSGVLTLTELQNVLQNAEIQMISKTSPDSVTSINGDFRRKDFAEYELKVIKANEGESVYLDGTCRETQDISAYFTKFNELERTVSEVDFPNPLDFKVNVAGMNVGFPVDVKMRNTGSQNSDGDDEYDIDLNLGLSTDVYLGRGVRLNIAPNVVMPFARDVSGIQNFDASNLTRDFIPTEVGVRFNMSF